MLFLESYPAMSCFNGVPFLVPVGWVLCYMYSAPSLQVVFVSLGRDPSL